MAANMNKNYAQYDGRSSEERALERYTKLIIEKMKAIEKNRMEPWFTVDSTKWPRGLSGRDFNSMNALMLLLHCEKNGYRVPLFFTFDQVMGLNNNTSMPAGNKHLETEKGDIASKVSVLKGAKSFPVLFSTYTIVHSDTKAKINYDYYKKLSKGKQAEYKVYSKQQVCNVFNVDQTNMREVRPELYNKFKEENRALPPELTADVYKFPAIDEILMNDDWICPIYLRDKYEAYYSPACNEIVLPGKEHFDEGEAFYGAVLQEMIHSTGSNIFLDRYNPNNNYWGTSENKGEELLSELGSALVMRKHGYLKTIKKENSAYIKTWLDSLEKSPEFLKNVMAAVKSSTAIVNEKIESVNRRLLEEIADMQKKEILYVTEMPQKMVSEFRMSDKESCDAVYKLLLNDFYDKDTNKPIEICRPSEKTVRLDSKYIDEALDYVYNCLDSESLSKLVAVGNYFNGYPIENYSDFFNKRFTTEFENRRNNPAWLEEQGLGENVVWDLKFISDDGYHLVKATLGEKSKLGALDYNCNIFLPFTDVGEDINLETDLGYMTEFRRRLLYQNGKVDAFGRISFAGPMTRDAKTGIVSRKLLIDGEAKATFVLKPDDYIYDLNFVLDLEKSSSEEFVIEDRTGTAKHWFGDVSYNKLLDVYQVVVKGIRDLLVSKDKFYPIRVITEDTNMALLDYCISKESRKQEKQELEVIKEKAKIHPGLTLFKNNDGMCGLLDSNERVVVHPRWLDCKAEANGDVIFCGFTTRYGLEVPDSSLHFTKNELMDMAKMLARISNLRVEQRGRSEDHWIAANIDGKPVLSEKITERDWIEYQGAAVSSLQLGMKYFSNIFVDDLEKNEKYAMRR